ncbi:hypothetical protein BDB01DRAFT_831742 [Pilobolus umbonatus]|nr:hypothetical protein BDB01DRAFT_831742 [Pilobolus umbonatus]
MGSIEGSGLILCSNLYHFINPILPCTSYFLLPCSVLFVSLNHVNDDVGIYMENFYRRETSYSRRFKKGLPSYRILECCNYTNSNCSLNKRLDNIHFSRKDGKKYDTSEVPAECLSVEVWFLMDIENGLEQHTIMRKA